jgi:hypothetical protein
MSDTPNRCSSFVGIAWHDQLMSATKGRTHRTGVSSAVELMVRVKPSNRAKAGTAAAALGVSLAAYIDKLLEHETLAEDGRPLWWDEAHQLDIAS